MSRSSPKRPDAPCVGRSEGFRPITRHPAFAAAQDIDDPVTARLVTLLALNPGIVAFRTTDMADLDAVSKKYLLGQILEVLGLDDEPKKVMPYAE